jgi:histidinol-phosphate/aromatic aminotransferase/cobyric acid decarboxylase-like protein
MGEPARVHGGLYDDEAGALGLDPREVIDFSVNCNPYGPCAEVLDAIRGAAVDRYPDPTAAAVRRAIAGTIDVEPAAIALGNGACELLWTLARVLVRPGARVAIVEPTFGEFRAAIGQCGGVVDEWRASPANGFAIDLGAVDAVARAATLLYVCSPNTPTGASIDVAEVARVAAARPSTTVVLDQSFLSLSERASDARTRVPPNVVRVRSLTKDHAIPGLRVGYLIAATALVARIEAARPAWTTSAIAQAAARAAIRASRFVDDSRARVLADRAALVAVLRRLGLAPAPSTTGFVLVRVGDAAGLRARLLARHRVLVRDCASFGLPDHVRLAARPAADLDRLAIALAAELRC